MEAFGRNQTNLTQSQQLMWLGQSLHPETPLYSMIYSFTLHGELNLDAFQQAISALITQSDIFRTIIFEVDGVPQQRVVGSFPYSLPIVDFSSRPNAEAASQTWIEEAKIKPWRMDQCLFEMALLKISAEKSIWYLNQHHIVCDAASFALTYHWVADAYQKALQHQVDGVRPIPAFEDQVSAEKALATTDEFAAAQAHWQAKLNKPWNSADIYSPSQHTSTTQTRRTKVELGFERTNKLNKLIEQDDIRSFGRDLTLFNVFATVLAATVSRLSGNQQVRVGAPSGNRRDERSKSTLGLFIEVPLLEIEFKREQSFQQLTQQVNAETFSLLRNTLSGISSAELNRGYDVLLNFVNTPYADFAGLQSEINWVHSGHGDNGHKIRLQVHQFNGGDNWTLLFDCNKGVFSAENQAQFTTHFLTLFDAFLADPHQPINQVDLLTRNQKLALLGDFNATDTAFPQDETVRTLFESQVAKTPFGTAVSDEGKNYSYSQCESTANFIAENLKQAKIRPNDLIGVCLHHSAEMVVSLLGILKAGAAFVPLDPAHPDERLATVIADADLALVITTTDIAPRLGSVEIMLVDGVLANSAENTPSLTTVTSKPTDLAYVLYTSGSTGTPKGVQIEQRGLTNYISWAAQQYVNVKAASFALFTSLAFDLTITSIFVPLVTGGEIVIYGQDSAERGMAIFDVIKDNKVDVVKATPAHLSMIGSEISQATRLNTLIVGGEQFKINLATDIQTRLPNARIFNEYGPTETVVGAMIHEFDREQDASLNAVPIGTPIANTQIYLLDDNLMPVPTGITGEMCIGGSGVARGYLNRPEKTAQAFALSPHPSISGRIYRTGDLGRWENGRLTLLGRKDAQVKIGGARIELGEIEAALLEFTAIESAVAVIHESAPPSMAPSTQNCVRCGLPGNYPSVTFTEDGCCSVCVAFADYRPKTTQYFKSLDAFDAIVQRLKAQKTGRYDSLILLSGGKDSTYVLYQAVLRGLTPLVFTLDNGYISEGAKANIRRVCADLKVDHIFGRTDQMNAIFAESLQKFSNVCQGCFKTIYTLAINLAHEHGIRAIITGLSRGQFFETRLTPTLFANGHVDINAIDQSVLEARQAYHKQVDGVTPLQNRAVFDNPQLFEQIEFVDFYRYCDVDLDELYAFLDQHAPWIRPKDTGRSTNCLINDVGIYVHQRERGYHNYALPYSWDVRLGVKEREAALDELADDLDEAHIQTILRDLNYTIQTKTEKKVAVYFEASSEVDSAELRQFLATKLPSFAIPHYLVQVDGLPLTPNGKVDRKALPDPTQADPTQSLVEPETPVEETLVELWCTALNLPQVGVDTEFLQVGGASLQAIQIVTAIRHEFGVKISLSQFFEAGSIQRQADLVEDAIIADIEQMTDEEAALMLAKLG